MVNLDLNTMNYRDFLSEAAKLEKLEKLEAAKLEGIATLKSAAQYLDMLNEGVLIR